MKKTFAFSKQTFAQTNYNSYEFMILLNNVTYIRVSFFVTPRKFVQKFFTMNPIERMDDSKLHSYIGFC